MRLRSSSAAAASSALLLLLNVVGFASSQDCPDEYAGTASLGSDDSTTFSYAIVGDYLCGQVESAGERWVAVGVSPDGKMQGGESIVGAPDDGTVEKYDMVFGSITAMSDEEQTLTQTSVTQAGDGKTVMKFAKLLKEDGEHEILADGDTTFVWAVGNGNSVGYHAARGLITLNAAFAADAQPERATCDFCPDGVPDLDVTRPGGFTCGATVDFAATIGPDVPTCAVIKEDEVVCCPSASEVPAVAAEDLICPDEYAGSASLGSDDSTTFSYAIVDGWLCGQVESEGERWVAVGVSPDGKMQDGESIVGAPDDGTVEKYDMVFGSITAMSDEKQTLTQTSVTQAGDGKTVMKFAKLLKEDGEHEILADGDTTFVWAVGNGNSVGYHAARGLITLNAAFAADAQPERATCDFCPDGVPDLDVTRPGGFTCGATVDFAATIGPDVPTCAVIKEDEVVCCPSASEAPAKDCIQEMCEEELEAGTLNMKYQINVPDDTTADVCEGCTISMELVYEGEAWVSLGFSTDGQMIGSEAVVGIPGEGSVQKFSLVSKGGDSAIVPMDQQTLTDTSIEVKDGKTIMKFTKIMNEPGEIEITPGDNTFLWAYGMDSELGYHKARDSFELNLSSGGADPEPPAKDCAKEMCEEELEAGALNLKYRINVPDDTTADVCEGCTVSMEVVYEGEAWVSLGFSTDGQMIGSEAVIGIPGEGSVQKYKLISKVDPAIELMESQTLTDTSIEFKDGQTIMKFTKIMNEPGEIEITTGDNIFLWAYGMNSALGYHKSRNSFELNLSSPAPALEPVEPPATEPAAGPVSEPAGPARDCFKEMCEEVLEAGKYYMKYQINVPTDTTSDVCEGCTISMELLYEGDAWVSIATSLDGQMIGGEAVIGIPEDGTVQKYNLVSKGGDATKLMDQQTLLDTSIEVIGGQTIMKFTKTMNEPEEIEISAGDNTFLWAYGTGPPLGYHAKRESFELNLSSGASVAIEVPNKSAWLAHGILAFLAWGVLVPFAVNASLLRELLPAGPLWIKLHKGLNSVGFFFFVITFFIAVGFVNKEGGTHFDIPHEKMGLAMFLMAIAQVSSGVFRPHLPHPGEEKTEIRKAFEIGHRILGVTLLACGFWQMYRGIELYAAKYSVSESDKDALIIAYWVWIVIVEAIMIVGGGFFKLKGNN